MKEQYLLFLKFNQRNKECIPFRQILGEYLIEDIWLRKFSEDNVQMITLVNGMDVNGILVYYPTRFRSRHLTFRIIQHEIDNLPNKKMLFF